MRNFNMTKTTFFEICERNQQSWLEILGSKSKPEPAIDISSSHIDGTILTSTEKTSIFPCISSAIKWIVDGRDPKIAKPDIHTPNIPSNLADSEHIQIVATGSFHLVGGVIRFLGPEICEKYFV